MFDVVMKINGNKSFCIFSLDVFEYPTLWSSILDNLIQRVVYRRTSRLVRIPGVGESLVNSGIIDEDKFQMMKILRIKKSAMGLSWEYGLKESLNDILGKDFRNEVWVTETHLWSEVELSNFFIARFDGMPEPGSSIYWKTELGLNSSEITDIENPNTVWYPKYSQINNVLLFS